MRNQKLVYVISVLMIEALGFAVGVLTRTGTQLYAQSINKPPLSPPGVVFPVAWTILYALIGIGLARILLSTPSGDRTIAIMLFAVQLLLNLAWCFIFFGSQNYLLALIELVIMLAVVVIMIVFYRKIDSVAAGLQIPYVLWLCFATYLNLGVILLN